MSYHDDYERYLSRNLHRERLQLRAARRAARRLQWTIVLVLLVAAVCLALFLDLGWL